MSAPKSITVIGGTNLFQIAAQYYGDAMEWNRIAQANGLGPDPFITATTPITINLPRANALASTDGIYAV
jgi:nucleoid-associated protein YgaU